MKYVPHSGGDKCRAILQWGTQLMPSILGTFSETCLKIRKVQFLKILCIPSKHWGWSCIAIGVGCLLLKMARMPRLPRLASSQ